mmetsp:Transcript_26124/g.30173  ORF Transcript_26124/g.30173 Transcript_26124/m.30173 type:complete len:100 (-) Transcript_26124:9-308(-)
MDEWTAVGDMANKLTSNYPRSYFVNRLKKTSFFEWLQESHDIAINVVYNGITPNSTLSPEYIKKGTEVINEQLAIAGYRLADLIISLDSLKIPKKEISL